MDISKIHKGELAVLAFFVILVGVMLYVGLVINTPWWEGCGSSVTPSAACG